MRPMFRSLYVLVVLLVCGGIVIYCNYYSTNSIQVGEHFRRVTNFISDFQKNASTQSDSKDFDLKVFSVQTRDHDGYFRMIRSANYYNIEVETLGFGHKWEGFGTKLNLVREAIEPYKNDSQTIIMFVDGEDLLFTNTMDVMVQRFKKFDARILFAAERTLWPDKSLEHLYPNVTDGLLKYLNAGVFMGYGSALYELLRTPNDVHFDDQLYHTKAFLDMTFRKKFQFKLDHRSEIFMCMNFVENDFKLMYNETKGEYYVKNVLFDTVPCIIHANGYTDPILKDYGRYLASHFKFDLREQLSKAVLNSEVFLRNSESV